MGVEIMLVNCGKGISIEIATDKLPPAAMEHVVKIGLKNLLQDAHAGIRDPAKARAKVETKLATLMRGEIRQPMAIRLVNPQEKIALMKAITEVWETSLEHLSTFKSIKRDAQARKLTHDVLAP